MTNEAPCKLGERPGLVIHLISLRAFDPTFQPDLDAIRRMQTQLPIIGARGWGTYYDLEGIYVAGSDHRNDRIGYIYAFRNGALEVLDLGVLACSGPEKTIPSLKFENELLENLPRWLAALQAMRVDPPVMMLISLLNVQGYSMALPAGADARSARAIKRDEIQLPGILIQSLQLDTSSRNTPDNIFDVMRPQFDALWNACGVARSIYFDANGNRLEVDYL